MTLCAGHFGTLNFAVDMGFWDISGGGEGRPPDNGNLIQKSPYTNAKKWRCLIQDSQIAHSQIYLLLKKQKIKNSYKILQAVKKSSGVGIYAKINQILMQNTYSCKNITRGIK